MNEHTVAVAGATGGLGSAVAGRFARDGATLVVSARDSGALDVLAEELESAGGRVTSHRADVRDEFDVERLFRVAADHGPVDVVIAAVGV